MAVVKHHEPGVPKQGWWRACNGVAACMRVYLKRNYQSLSGENSPELIISSVTVCLEPEDVPEDGDGH